MKIKIPIERLHSCVILPAVFMLLFAACSSIPKDFPPLERARAAYAQARTAEGIATLAPVELYEAGQKLHKAEGAKNVRDMEHLSYLAERQAQIAVAMAERKKAENETALLNKEKNKVLLEARAQQAESAWQKAKNLEEELTALKARKTDQGIVLTIGDVLFATGRADLMPGAMRDIDKLSEFLKKNGKRNVLIEGHTDSVGSDDYNLGLSQRRADSVRWALLSRGISSGRVVCRGYGERYPVASNDTAAGRQQNRRVEIVILNEGLRPENSYR